MSYGLFGILAVICIFGLIANKDTAPQNVCMGIVGFGLAPIMSSLLKNMISAILPSDLSDSVFILICVEFLHILLLYGITLLLGWLMKKVLLSEKGILRFQQTWYIADAVFMLLATIYLFDNLIVGPDDSIGKVIYNNILHISGYLLVMILLLFAMRRFYFEKVQAEAKQKAVQDLQEYTNNLETMYNGLRSFKHDYINILLSVSGYIENGDTNGLKNYFENNVLPTKNLIDQGDYKLNQLSNIGVPEIKSLLSVKMIYVHESGIDVTIDIPDPIEHFAMERYTLQTNKTHKVYTIELGGRKISVDYNDVFFFETSGNIHKIILHAKDRQIEFSGTIKEAANILDSSFVRCHRSFLVNKNNIKEVDAKNRIVHFPNGETCMMSTRMMKGV